MSAQPEYKLIGNLGDRNPLDYGGFFVYVDATGVYDPQAELVIPPEDGTEDDENAKWTVYRFDLPRCTYDPESGVLSDNKFHPQHSAWFAHPEDRKDLRPQDSTYLSKIASFAGADLDQLRDWLCSDNALERAGAYQLIGEYHGWENFDSYPLTFNKEEVTARYKEELTFCRK